MQVGYFISFHNAAIWGQCWPPWSQHGQMGYIHTSGGKGRERKRREAWKWEGRKREREARRKSQTVGGYRKDHHFNNYTSFTDQRSVNNLKTESVSSRSRCTNTHFDTHPPQRHLTALTHFRALFQAQPITSLSVPGIPIAPVTMRSYV